MGCVDFGESVESSFCVRNQVLLLGGHGEQRLWKHNQTHRVKHTLTLEMDKYCPLTRTDRGQVKNVIAGMNHILTNDGLPMQFCAEIHGSQRRMYLTIFGDPLTFFLVPP